MTSALASAFGVMLLTACAALAAIAWRIAVLAIANALQISAIVNTLQSSSRAEHPPKLGQQWGGGEHVEEHAVRVMRIAGALRQLGETVNAPGIKAIKGVLLVLDKATSQADAASQTGSTVKSIRKYRPLVENVLAAIATTATFAASVAVAGPAVTSIACGTLAAAVLPPVIKALPNVTNVHLSSEHYQPDNGRVYRVWRATVRASDGSKREMDTKPVLHEPAPQSETQDERLKRDHAEQQRIVRALRALDDVASSAHRAKELRRDRARKRKQAAKRAAQLPALPLADGDSAWELPISAQPHYVGEHVWLVGTAHLDNASSANTASSTATMLGSMHFDGGPTAGEPAQYGVRINGTMDGSVEGQPLQAATILQLYRDGSAKLELADGSGQERVSAQQLKRIVTDDLIWSVPRFWLDSLPEHLIRGPTGPVPSTVQVPIYVGQSVQVECGHGPTQTATITSVREDGTVDVQLSDGCVRRHVYVYQHVDRWHARTPWVRNIPLAHIDPDRLVLDKHSVLWQVARGYCEGVRAQSSDGEEEDGEEDREEDCGEENGEEDGEEEEEAGSWCMQCCKWRCDDSLVWLTAKPDGEDELVCAACASGSSTGVIASDGEWMTYQVACKTLYEREEERRERARKELRDSMPKWYRLKLENAQSREMTAVATRMHDKERHGPNWEGPGVWPTLANPRGPQLYRSPGFPMCCDGAVCSQTNTHHFDIVDHPPDHPYLALRQAEDEGYETRDAREHLSNIHKSKFVQQMPRSAWGADGKMPIEDLVFTTTHRVLPGADYQQELYQRMASENATCLAQKRELVQNECGCWDWAPAVEERKRRHAQLTCQHQSCHDRAHQTQPKFLRVAERMKRWRQTQIEWHACKRQRIDKS